MELELLQGAKDILTYFRPMLYVEDSTGKSGDDVDLDLNARTHLVERFPMLFPPSSNPAPNAAGTASSDSATIDDIEAQAHMRAQQKKEDHIVQECKIYL